MLLKSTAAVSTASQAH